jgi:hypothetical protein
MGGGKLTRRLSALAALSAAVVAAGPPAATATMPPKTCGPITVRHHRYLVKADQISCTFAKTWAARYLVGHRKPPRYTCTRQPATSRIRVFCRQGYRTYFAQR